MSAQIKQIGPLGLITISGELDGRSASEIRELAEDSSLQDATHLAIELSNVTFADSTGIGFIVSLKKQRAKDGRRVALIGLSGQPLDIVKLTRIDKSVDIFKDLEAFIASLESDDRQAVAQTLSQGG